MKNLRAAATPRRMIGAGVAALLVAGSVTAIGATASSGPAPRAIAVLPSVIPAWAQTARVLGATPSDQQVLLSIALKGQDEAGLLAFDKAVSTPGNPLYRHYLTKEQYQAKYAPLGGALTTVTAVLKTLGITNVMSDKLGDSLLVGLPASLATTVFGVRFQQVMHAGQSTRVALNQPTLPSALLPFVVSISGFSQERVHTDHTITPAAAPAAVPAANLPIGGTAPTGFYNAQPMSDYYGQKQATTLPTNTKLAADPSTTKPYLVSGYTPAQVRGAYGVTQTTYTGKGVNIGVVLWDDGPNVSSDLAAYSSHFGLTAPKYTDLSPENQLIDVAAGGAPVIAPLDAASEQTLDVEAIHAMAPDAGIVYSGAVAPEDPAIYVASVTAIADGVDAINNSYGGTGDTDPADAAVFQNLVTAPAMSMGVGLDYSTGDAADDVTADGQREVDFPSSSDQVTAVGGTLIEIGGANDYEGEAYWGTYSAALSSDGKSWTAFSSQAGGAGGGGGVSTNFAEPSWQKGVVPDSEAVNADTASGYNTANGSDPTYSVPGSPGRVTPDVAMIADSTTGFLVGETEIPDVGTDGSALSANNAYNWYRIGGTSVSSPIFTGMMALVDQALGKSAGFVNPTIYTFLAKKNGAFRDPQLGRSATGSRLGSTAAQMMAGTCTGDVADSNLSCTGTGPGSVGILSEVRPDYTDTANPGYSDGNGGPNTVVYHLREQGVLGTLEDLPGYDDSTGLGSPYAPAYIADFLGVPYTPTPSASPTVAPTTKPTTKSSCAVRSSSVAASGPAKAGRNAYSQVKFTFTLKVLKGQCKTPSAVGRALSVYVDGKKVGALRTGKGGKIAYLVTFKSRGKHAVTVSFPGNRDLKKSSSKKASITITS